MNEKVKTVFELLDVEPYERFKIDNGVTNYYFDRDLNFWVERDGDGGKIIKSSSIDLLDILNGNYKIIKPPKPKQWTKEEKLIAQYWKLMGAKYIAKDSADNNNRVYIYYNKPYRGYYCWIDGLKSCPKDEIKYDMPNLHWEDEAATLLDDILK